MSHVPASANWPKEAFERGHLLKLIEHNNWGVGSRPYGIDGDLVTIRGHIVPAPTLSITWLRYGPRYDGGGAPHGNQHIVVGKRALTEDETARVINAVNSGRFAFLPTGPQDQFYLELVPVEYCPIAKGPVPNYVWSGRWEVA